MPLEEYRTKRNFAQTSEPRGRLGGKRRQRIFVVQHHRASHDHDDFRLELNGTLKSWAVPKRVSTKAGDRRLAVEVEDHPLAYATFEGRIPEGQYGAGTVKLWDAGTWEPEGDNPTKALKAGKLSFVLHGQRLKGTWTLVRMRETDPPPAKHQWLLIRKGAVRQTRAVQAG